MNDEAAIGVYVLGMHRSGTSLATRVVNLLGVPLSIQSDWFPPAPDNPAGFWESSALIDVNNRLLRLLGGTPALPPTLEDGWEQGATIEPIRSEALRTFSTVHPTRQWVWKDPRTCITFPFWRQLLPASPVVVLVHRHPRAVARSLTVREPVLFEHAMALWDRYMVSATRGAAGFPTYVLDYDRLVTDHRFVSTGIADFLANQGVTLRAATDWQRDVDDFVQPALNHSSTEEQDASTPPLHEWLLAATGPHPRLDPPAWIEETVQTREFFARPRSPRKRFLRVARLIEHRLWRFPR